MEGCWRGVRSGLVQWAEHCVAVGCTERTPGPHLPVLFQMEGG